MKIVSFLLVLLHVSVFARDPSPSLPPDEVDVLRKVANTLMKSTWNFSVNPCNTVNEGGWRNSTVVEGAEDAVTCDCSYLEGSTCHVISILLKSQDLQGTLPKELVGLPFLQEINLARNYLSGSIPTEWGALPLVNLTLLGNRLTGPIPKELGKIITLQRLVLENNELSGSIPPELGRLLNIQRLFLSSNQLKGKIPSSFSRLTNMRVFRISDNCFKGPIPKFIEKWTLLETLVLYSSGLVGPIPQSISRLTNLKDLMISDLGGPESSFPPLENLKKMRNLVLRNINLTGELPSYLGTNTTDMRLLNLSFNKLRGPIPNSYEVLRDIENIYLTGNMLSGSIPSWMPKETDGDVIDLSYNHFSEDKTTRKCVDNHMIQFASSYTITNNSLEVFCLKSFQCPQTFPGLHINCGGDEVTINGTTYDADKYDRQPLFYESSLRGWVLSNTGHFLDDNRVNNGSTTWSDSSKLASVADRPLYAHARLSAISLTYYAMCLQNGAYKVNLHFAEIVFGDKKSYRSLGRRYFNVYIQEKLVLEDFNIAKEAGGVGKPIVKTFPVLISEGKLHIRFYWAGKGTSGIPNKGVYGPLVSAISVDPDFDRASIKGGGHSVPLGIAIAIGLAVAISTSLLVFCALWFGGCLKTKSQMERDFRKLDLQINAFSLRQIRVATNDFAIENKIGEGGFGPVYKGMMPNGTAIAVKQLSEFSKQGNRQFLNEIGMISALQHPALVKLHGCCVEGRQLLVVYEYLTNNSLAKALFGPLETQIRLDWPTRQKICLGIAKGLAYLHEESRLKILHRDIKADNILLDQDLNPKISDFGLAKLDNEDHSHITTQAIGTFGYMAPEYVFKGHLSDKTDVYSFGVVLMEIIHGQSNTATRPGSDDIFFVDWVRLLWKRGELASFVDPRLQSYALDDAIRTVKVALLCTSRSPVDRPSMSAVVSMLEGHRTAEIDTWLSAHDGQSDEEPPDLMKIMAEIDLKFETGTIHESPETTLGERQLLPGKGKKKMSSDSLSFRDDPLTSVAESSGSSLTSQRLPRRALSH